jgi:predicted O-methyltransferase YrrM
MPKEPDKLWVQVDRYFTEQLHLVDSILDATMQANAAAKLPAIDVAPNQGRFLQLLIRLCGASRVLEVGTLGGYSTICMARALPPGGRLITLEYEPQHAEVAQANLQRAGLADRVEIRVGAALDSLPQLQKERLGPFDFIFIDADKPNNPNYLDWAVRLSRPGTLIVVDNVVRDGEVADPSSKDPSIQGTRRMFAAMSSDPRLTLSCTALQTVGSKGYDGFAMAIVNTAK